MSRWRAAVEAALVMAVAMGVGRFAFTAVYPHMVDEGLLDVAGGSVAASANYAGYLLGAMLAMRSNAGNAHRVGLAALGVTLACLLAMAFVQGEVAIVAVRTVAGVASALAMVATSIWLLETRGHAAGAPLLFGGVGAGIALSSELLVAGARAGWHSPGLWLLMAGFSAVVGAIAVPGLALHRAPVPRDRADGPSLPRLASAGPMLLVYGLAGFGYIVTATYLPLLMKRALPGIDVAHVWALFGLGALPSCVLWHRIHQRAGTRFALSANLAVQAVGVALPAVWSHPASYVLSALLVGGTFLGVPTIIMPVAQVLARASGRNLAATLTVVYSIGQIAGPLWAGWLYARSGGFSASLATAAIALAVAALRSAWLPLEPVRPAPAFGT